MRDLRGLGSEQVSPRANDRWANFAMTLLLPSFGVIVETTVRPASMSSCSERRRSVPTAHRLSARMTVGWITEEPISPSLPAGDVPMFSAVSLPKTDGCHEPRRLVTVKCIGSSTNLENVLTGVLWKSSGYETVYLGA